MGKKLLVVLLVAAFLAPAATAYADVEENMGAMSKKLMRGLINTFSGWVELPAQIVKGHSEGFRGDKNNKGLGMAWGIIDGVCHSIGRTLSGVSEVVGFWALNPKDNDGIGIPLDAKYAWEEGTPYDLGDPNFTDATMMPIGNKFLRGMGNALFGILELPGQIMKGVSEKAPDLGVLKGLWYWYSREVSGLSDVVTCLVPTPKDQLGVPFEDKWPWEIVTERMQ